MAWGWADSLQLLVERGHLLSEIRTYTLRQVRAFSEAAGRAKRRDMADSAAIARAAQYDKKDFEAFMKKLGG